MTQEEKDQLERKFIAWALARDDDWWEEGQGHVSIWDIRIMLDFFASQIDEKDMTRAQEIISASQMATYLERKRNITLVTAAHPEIGRQELEYLLGDK